MITRRVLGDMAFGVVPGLRNSDWTEGKQTSGSDTVPNYWVLAKSREAAWLSLSALAGALLFRLGTTEFSDWISISQTARLNGVTALHFTAIYPVYYSISPKMEVLIDDAVIFELLLRDTGLTLNPEVSLPELTGLHKFTIRFSGASTSTMVELRGITDISGR